MDLKELIASKTALEADMARIKVALSQVDAQIDDSLQDSVRERLAIEEKDTGTVNFVVDDVQVKVTIPKTVKWDQGILEEISGKIAASGDDPGQYMKVERKISETTYKAWPEQIQKVFIAARTVVTGKPKYEFSFGQEG